MMIGGSKPETALVSATHPLPAIGNWNGIESSTGCRPELSQLIDFLILLFLISQCQWIIHLEFEIGSCFRFGGPSVIMVIFLTHN
jgi:hypothetical protein